MQALGPRCFSLSTLVYTQLSRTMRILKLPVKCEHSTRIDRECRRVATGSWTVIKVLQLMHMFCPSATHDISYLFSDHTHATSQQANAGDYRGSEILQPGTISRMKMVVQVGPLLKDCVSAHVNGAWRRS